MGIQVVVELQILEGVEELTLIRTGGSVFTAHEAAEIGARFDEPFVTQRKREHRSDHRLKERGAGIVSAKEADTSGNDWNIVLGTDEGRGDEQQCKSPEYLAKHWKCSSCQKLNGATLNVGCSEKATADRASCSPTKSNVRRV